MRFKDFVGATPCGCPDDWGRHGGTTPTLLLDNDLGLLYITTTYYFTLLELRFLGTLRLRRGVLRLAARRWANF